MVCDINSVEQDLTDRKWHVYVKRADGSIGYIRLNEDSFIRAGTDFMGQILLQGLLAKAEPTP